MAFQPTATTHEREARSRGEAFAVATVVRAERPTSCLPGDKAVIRSDGRLQGWIGGSCAQPTVISEALASLEDGEPRLVLLTPDGVAVPRTGMTVHQMSCFSGGVVEVFIEPFLPAPQLIICGVSPAALRRVDWTRCWVRGRRRGRFGDAGGISNCVGRGRQNRPIGVSRVQGTLWNRRDPWIVGRGGSTSGPRAEDIVCRTRCKCAPVRGNDCRLGHGGC